MHNGHFYPIFVQKYPDFGQKVLYNDQGVPTLYPVAFQSRVALYMREYGTSFKRSNISCILNTIGILKMSFALSK